MGICDLFHCDWRMQVQFWAPTASGAGVSLIMGYLNGNNIPDLLSFRSMVTKFVGTCCGVCANIALGPEAPMVHLGACVAHGVTHAACGEPFSPSSSYQASYLSNIGEELNNESL